MSAGLAWLRPHVKTHKMAEVSQLLLQAGITKFKCATIAEAEMLAQVGTPDVLFAYQPNGPKINRLLQLVQTFPDTQFSCLIDNVSSAESIARIFNAAGLVLPVYVDLNVGMNRTGIQPDQEALELYKTAASLLGINPIGLHAYDGHIRDADLTIRAQKCNLAFTLVTTLADQIQAAGFPYPVLVAGGSPTFPIHAKRPGVESSPGTFIFWDWGYAQVLTEQPFRYAALVVTRVISKLNSTTLCLDLGHKSVAAENPLPRVVFLNAPDATPIAQSEEHLVVKVLEENNYQVGDVFYGVPVHICPTTALYDKAYVIQDNLVTTAWPVISRNRSITI